MDWEETDMIRYLAIAHLIFFFYLSISSAESFGYGDTANGLPNWRERSIIVLTNACRMAPPAYRDKYVGNYPTILQPANYPATYPLYWNQYLNQSARVHAIDMATNCGMQHPSCDGTAWDARVKSYYKSSSWIGENISTGSADAVAALRQWIMDGSTPAVDKSGSDGHRANIMSNNYKEMGAGYAYGTIQYRYFWVQDFGGGTPVFTNKIYAGSHFFLKTDTTSFMANFYDAAGTAPTEASVTVGGSKYAMAVDVGATGKGTYIKNLKKGTGCREYFFTFTTGSGTQSRYPEQGYLVTSGEGTCTMDYSPTQSTIELGRMANSAGQKSCRFWIDNSHAILQMDGTDNIPIQTLLFQSNGRQVCAIQWAQNSMTNYQATGKHILSIPFNRSSTSSYLIARHQFASGYWIGQQIVKQ
jgi:hypothetical protein